MEYKFPDDFIWGAATAALQIEGAVAEGGRGPSHWEVYRQTHPERFWEGASPDVACDHYHHYREDVALIKAMGHNGYRMSIVWPRIYPAGTGALNPAGVDFYNRLFDALLANGAAPCVTLYHWDLPQALAERGGWENRETVDAFVRYCETCFRLFGDRVKLWATFNEPDITILMGYIMGTHPPLKQQDYQAAMQAAHHIVIAHSRAVQACHRAVSGGKIGDVINLSTIYPATDAAEDKAAAAIADGMLNRWFIDPVMLGAYPADMVELYRGRGWLPPISDEDLALMQADRLDWIGVNYYFPYHASGQAAETALAWNFTGKREQKVQLELQGLFKMVEVEGARRTDWGWEIDPEGLYNILATCDRYIKGIPIYITENGVGLKEELVDGTVDDQARIDFVREHLQVVHRAIANGINVKGYYMWALMDNFSWLSGYRKRYGFLFVDRATLARYRKKSSYWFQQVAQNHGF